MAQTQSSLCHTDLGARDSQVLPAATLILFHMVEGTAAPAEQLLPSSEPHMMAAVQQQASDTVRRREWRQRVSAIGACCGIVERHSTSVASAAWLQSDRLTVHTRDWQSHVHPVGKEAAAPSNWAP